MVLAGLGFQWSVSPVQSVSRAASRAALGLWVQGFGLEDVVLNPKPEPLNPKPNWWVGA